MNLDLTKYLKNKDIKFKNEDFDIDSLQNDLKVSLTKGLISEDEAKNRIKDAEKAKETEWSSKYSQVETNYNNTLKQLNDTNDKASKLSLEKTMLLKGFKEEQFDKVSKMRSSLYEVEKDDNKALESIATEFKATFFPEANAKPIIPQESGLNGGNNGANNGASNGVKIDRNTPLSNMLNKS